MPIIPLNQCNSGSLNVGRCQHHSLVIDKNNPLSEGLWGVFLPTTGALYNLVDGEFLTVQSGASLATNKLGRTVRFDGTSTARLIVNSGPIGEDFTVLTKALYDSGTKDQALFDINNQQFVVWADTTAAQLRPTSYAGSVLIGTNGSIPSDGATPIVWGGVYNWNGANLIAQNWVGSKKDGSSGSIGSSSSYSTSNNIALGANFNTAAKESKADHDVIMVWSRALSDAEMKSASENIYQVLKPANESFIFVSSGAPPAPTFKAYWAHSANTIIQGGM
jgi:hypothetical protein